MNGNLITLGTNGEFEVFGTTQDGSSVKILFEDNVPSTPWVVIQEGSQWNVIGSYASLDAAMALAIKLVYGTDANKFTVRLPDGMSFSRPGKKPVEQVMASYGWVFVTELIGFLSYKSTKKVTQFGMRSELLKMIPSKDVRLGEINLSDETVIESHWIADLCIDYFGWIKISDIETEAKNAFEIENVSVLPYYDYRTRLDDTPYTAIVIDFPVERVRKAA